ncbi:MAG: hypothetical protein DRG63_13180 [Deltaproteobacteria bacterium]|nr:MAG: hypothetical protein DRG63_13180 [Deltaproteobacteria bacterium]
MVPRIKARAHRNNHGGFTLLELLVTITLVSMVVLVLSLALKLALGAWERGEREGKALACVTIPRLLEKQLESIVHGPGINTRGGKARFSFCGNKNAFSFFSCFAPMGSGLQGILRMTYVYDSDRKTLFLYEQPITRNEDLREELDPLSEKWNGELKPVGKVEGITCFDLMYSGQDMVDPEDEDQWKEQWPCDSLVPPRAVRLAISAQENGPHLASVWYFRVGKQTRF